MPASSAAFAKVSRSSNRVVSGRPPCSTWSKSPIFMEVFWRPGVMKAAQRSLHPSGSFLDQAEIGIARDIELGWEKAELMHEVDIALQGRDVNDPIRIAIKIVLGENPVFKARRGLLQEAGDQPDGLLAVDRGRDTSAAR